MIQQSALGEFAVDVSMGIHFYLHTPTTFLACQPRQLYAHYTPQTPEEEECQRFLRGYGLQLQKPKQSDNLGLAQGAIRHLFGSGWQLLAGSTDLDPWSGNIITLRRLADWPGAGEHGWETCSIHTDPGPGGPYLELERNGQRVRCVLDLMWTDTEVKSDDERVRRRLLAAYGWLTNRETALRSFVGMNDLTRPPARWTGMRHLMCLLLRQTWEPIEYGPVHRGPVARCARFRRPYPSDYSTGGMEQAWAECLSLTRNQPGRVEGNTGC